MVRHRTTRTDADLRRTLAQVDGKGYKAYQALKGTYQFQDFTLFIDHVQGDPFAFPSRVRVRLSQRLANFPQDTYQSKSRRIALCDYLARMFVRHTRAIAKGRRGTGHSGRIEMDSPGQEVLERTAILIGNDYLEARFLMGLPAAGRRILGREAQAMFDQELPQIVAASLLFSRQDQAQLYRHLDVVEDADYLRAQLKTKGLVAFVADTSILPRASGIDDRPLQQGPVVPFQSPESLRVTWQLPNRGRLQGMGIPQGVTLIVGGGYHGKSTLLQALQRGIYNHIPGDGREFVVAHPDAVKIRAEDGRCITRVNISPFINHLPFGRDTLRFSTGDASGSTSQAANIMEALEAGARVLLIDEDTSATNFMIRDRRMQQLVAKAKEPITPFIDKVRQLYQSMGVSTILVMGGSGDYFDVADTVIAMEQYRSRDVTAKARHIAAGYQTGRQPEGGEQFGILCPRRPIPHSLNPRRGKREVRIDARGLHAILFGTELIDLTALEQLVDISQTRAIGAALYYARQHQMNQKQSIRDIVETLCAAFDQHGLDLLAPYPVGDYARPRKHEIAATINRLRTLQIAD